MHDYEVRPRRDHRGVDLISDVLPFGRLWYDTPDNAIGYAMHSSRSHDAVIRVHDATDNVIETHDSVSRAMPREASSRVGVGTSHPSLWRMNLKDRGKLLQSSLPEASCQ
jgi:hypothetical protein